MISPPQQFHEHILTSIPDWGNDPYTLNPHFGTADDLKSLSDALHSRGMSLMIDVVINHFAADQASGSVDYSVFPAPFNSASAFHSPCGIDYTNQGSIENCWLVTDTPSLPDVASENGDVYTAMVNSVVDIVKTYGIDGIRLDTARHVPKEYLTQFQDAVGVYVTGEVLDGNAEFVAGYEGPLASVLNYPLWYALIDSFMGQDFSRLASMMSTEVSLFSDVNALANFLDNHDQPRFASREGNDVVRDRNAATYLMFTSGIPVVYYGFEHRFGGAADPTIVRHYGGVGTIPMQRCISILRYYIRLGTLLRISQGRQSTLHGALRFLERRLSIWR